MIRETYETRKTYERYATQAKRIYLHRKRSVRPLDQLTWPNLWRAIEIFARIIWRVGICIDYRKEFWIMTRRELRQGNVDSVC